MTTLKRGMVLDVNLDPTLGSETGKIRPCIIVTNDVYNQRVPVIQVVPITAWSAKKAKITTNVEINPTRNNGELGLVVAWWRTEELPGPRGVYLPPTPAAELAALVGR